MTFLENSRHFRLFVYCYRPENENPKIRENIDFWVYKVRMDMNLLFDHYFNVLNAKTEINKNLPNLVNLDWLEAFKRQRPGT